MGTTGSRFVGHVHTIASAYGMTSLRIVASASADSEHANGLHAWRAVATFATAYDAIAFAEHINRNKSAMPDSVARRFARLDGAELITPVTSVRRPLRDGYAVAVTGRDSLDYLAGHGVASAMALA